jgi:hypothetical protein
MTGEQTAMQVVPGMAPQGEGWALIGPEAEEAGAGRAPLWLAALVVVVLSGASWAGLIAAVRAIL